MATSKDTTLRWISDEQQIHLTADYGCNLRSVTDALANQKQRNELVTSYQKQIDTQDAAKDPYKTLKGVSERRLNGLQDVGKIAELEVLFGELSSDLSETAATLVKSQSQRKLATSDDDEHKVVSQNNILAVRDNWRWISNLVKCTETHLANSSEYHQFFHEVKENEAWMPVELRAAQNKVKLNETTEGTNKEGQRWLLDIKELLVMFLHWENKVEALFDMSKTVVPVPLRVEKLDYYRPVVSLVDYKTNDIDVKEGEELLLIDNSKAQSWQIKNIKGLEAHVPSIICVIPGPEPSAIQAAMSLRLQLLTEWTLNVKRVGKSLILFLILVLRDLTKDEVEQLRAMPQNVKNQVLDSLTYMENTLGPYWKGYAGFDELQSRIAVMRDILSEQGDPKNRNEELEKQITDKTETVEELLRNFMTVWSQWEAYKILVESSRHADNILIVDKWEQLKFIPLEELRRLWQNGLTISDGENSDFDTWLQDMKNRWNKKYFLDEVVEEVITVTEEREIEATIEKTTEKTTTSGMSHAEHEEEKKFVITGVIDPQSGYEVSMQEAIKLGIINNDEGTYVNKKTGFAIPIPQAMGEGKIKGELKLVKKSEERKHDMGLITVQTYKESRPYTIQAVRDAKTDKKLTVDEAIEKKILDQQGNKYFNTMTNREMSLADALDSGLIFVKYDNTTPTGEPEVVTKTYAIHWVKDKLRNINQTFSKAVSEGLLDTETGRYFDNAKKEYNKITDAIKNGDIKATVANDPSAFDIDPKNIVVIETLDDIKSKLKVSRGAMFALGGRATKN